MASTPEVALNNSGGGGKVRQAEYGGSPARKRGADVALRLLLVASSVSGLVVLATSKQTTSIPVQIQPQLTVFVSRSAKFTHSPAFVYLLVALSVASLYGIISLIISAFFLSKSAPSSKALFKLMVLDLLMAAMMASATGCSGSVAYIGLKGNSHVLWNKICNIFDKFCRHVGSSTALSLVAAVVLLLLVILSSYNISRRSY